jgi:uncharacterized protein (TIGR02757 family)
LNNKDLKLFLDKLYLKYQKKYSSKDPLWILHEFQDEHDIEITGLIISCYSYGQVDLINNFINKFLGRINYKAYEFTSNFSEQKDKKYLKDLSYRFNTANDLTALIKNIRKVLLKYSSLKELFKSGYTENDENILPALINFSKALNKNYKGDRYYNYLIPDPSTGSTCKRLNLFLRWMIRKDEIDIGTWSEEFPASKLIMPIDIHVYRNARKLKLVMRKTYDMKFAIELTEKLKIFDPDDPVKYDFALCHAGMERKF